MKTDDDRSSRNFLIVALLISIGIIIYLLLLQHPHSTTTGVVIGVNPVLASYGNVFGPAPSGSFIPVVAGGYLDTSASPVNVTFNITSISSAGRTQSSYSVTLQPESCAYPCSLTAAPGGTFVEVIGSQSNPVRDGITGFSTWTIYFTITVNGVVQSSYSWTNGTFAPPFINSGGG